MIKEIKLNRLEQELRTKLNSCSVRKEVVGRLSYGIEQEASYDTQTYYMFQNHTIIGVHNKVKTIHINPDILLIININVEIPCDIVERVVKEIHGEFGFKTKFL